MKNSLSNQFLVAMPALDDPNFARSVTYICEHNNDGAMGVVINRLFDMTLGEILRQLDIANSNPGVEHEPVFVGGPVLPDRGFVLHRPHGRWESTLAVTANIALTSSRDVLDAIARGEGPRDCLFILGYAGWSAGQLESEMADNAWLSVPAEEHVLFDTPPMARWRAAAELIGIDPSLLSSDAGHA